MPTIPDWLSPIVDAAILVPLLVMIVRLTGLRSFAKLSASDFAVTVAIGSVVAATVLDPDVPWWRGAVALAALLAVQAGLSLVRRASPRLQRAIDNEPLVLLRDGVYDDAALRTARVTRDDVRQKLRQAGMDRLDDVALVVLETTGDVSVMANPPEPEIVAEVRGA